MNIRDAKLNGIRAASEIHHDLGIKSHIMEGMEQIDVFDALHTLDIPTLCRPLEGLLGAYFNNGEQRGILVTTKRRLPIQRFTAAHELGHFWLKHDQSFDTEETIKHARKGIKSEMLQEIEAEAFASEFLLPKSLLFQTAKRQGWNSADLKKPNIVYQLALRTGASYEATWIALLENRLINNLDAEYLSSTPPQNSKREILEENTLSDPWSEVFHLKQKDDKAHLIASPEDVVLIELEEHSNSGYLWMGLPDDQQFKLISSVNRQESPVNIGGVSSRRIYFQATGSINLKMTEQRPWQGLNSSLTSFEVNIDFYGKEQGLPRVNRK